MIGIQKIEKIKVSFVNKSGKESVELGGTADGVGDGRMLMWGKRGCTLFTEGKNFLNAVLLLLHDLVDERDDIHRLRVLRKVAECYSSLPLIKVFFHLCFAELLAAGWGFWFDLTTEISLYAYALLPPAVARR